MNSKDWKTIDMAIEHHKKNVQSYEQTSEPNSLLLKKYMKIELKLHRLYREATNNNKPTRRPRKKPEKPDQNKSNTPLH